jgi:hypothetical protein
VWLARRVDVIAAFVLVGMLELRMVISHRGNR